jgi:hypothetical protein
MREYLKKDIQNVRAYFESWADDFRFIAKSIRVAWSR